MGWIKKPPTRRQVPPRPDGGTPSRLERDEPRGQHRYRRRKAP